MTGPRITVLLLALVLIATLTSCATKAKGPTDQQRIARTMSDWKANLESANVDAMMALFSKNFKGDSGGIKEMQDSLNRAKSDGYLKDAKANLDKAKTAVTKDTATFGPVEVSGNFDTMTFQCTLKKEEDKVWRITGITQ